MKGKSGLESYAMEGSKGFEFDTSIDEPNIGTKMVPTCKA